MLPFYGVAKQRESAKWLFSLKVAFWGQKRLLWKRQKDPFVFKVYVYFNIWSKG